MFNRPVTIVDAGFQRAWLRVARKLEGAHWELSNVVVQIKRPGRFDPAFHSSVEVFAKAQGILDPKHVAYTIFPHGLLRRTTSAAGLFAAYNRSGGFYHQVMRIKPGWGTYFRRMTCYEGPNGPVNQIQNILHAINNRPIVNKAAFTIVIQHPGRETVRPRGGPCLNYITLQAQPALAGQPLTLGMLAVYRNHDFLERAYGNYWGLCNLLSFLANQVGGVAGPLTCISSHAYVPSKKVALSTLLAGLP